MANRPKQRHFPKPRPSGLLCCYPQGQATTGRTAVSCIRHMHRIAITPGQLENLVYGVMLQKCHNVSAASKGPACILLVLPKSMMVL